MCSRMHDVYKPTSGTGTKFCDLESRPTFGVYSSKYSTHHRLVGLAYDAQHDLCMHIVTLTRAPHTSVFDYH